MYKIYFINAAININVKWARPVITNKSDSLRIFMAMFNTP